MNNEAYIDFCFIREDRGGFSSVIDNMLKSMFVNQRLSWYLDEKKIDGAEMVVAEIKGMSTWKSEEEAMVYFEENADVLFWEYLQGYKMFIYPASTPGMHAKKSCATKNSPILKQESTTGGGCACAGH